MKPRIAAALRVWDGVFGWKRRREAAATLRHAATVIEPGSVVLDIGCGIGYALEVLAEDHLANAIGCDVIPPKRPRQDGFVRFDGWNLPFADGSVDVVLLIFVLHHAKDPSQLLREAVRVARGTLFVVEDTPSNGLDARWGKSHIRRFNKRHGIPWVGDIRSEAEWRRMFESNGLHVVQAAPLSRLERLPPVARTAFLLETGAKQQSALQRITRKAAEAARWRESEVA